MFGWVHSYTCALQVSWGLSALQWTLLISGASWQSLRTKELIGPFVFHYIAMYPELMFMVIETQDIKKQQGKALERADSSLLHSA